MNNLVRSVSGSQSDRVAIAAAATTTTTGRAESDTGGFHLSSQWSREMDHDSVGAGELDTHTGRLMQIARRQFQGWALFG